MRCTNCGDWVYRRNSIDDDLRNLERRAASGDLGAIERLRRVRARAQITSSGPKIAFRMVDKPAPWAGPDATVRRVDLENTMHSGPPSESVPTMWDGGRVWWSKDYNSHVLVIPDEGECAQFWHETEGQVNLYSVNGAGEVRWEITASDVEYDNDDGYAAALAFGLID